MGWAVLSLLYPIPLQAQPSIPDPSLCTYLKLLRLKLLLL